MDNEGGKLNIVKKIIHSLVISSPVQVTAQQLQRDFMKEEGYPIPFLKFGFNNIISFLQSIPDTVQVFGQGPMAVVNPVAHGKTAHIQHLVQCQKKSSTKVRAKHKVSPTIPQLMHMNGNIPQYNPYTNPLVFSNLHAYQQYLAAAQHFSRSPQMFKKAPPPPPPTPSTRMYRPPPNLNFKKPATNRCPINRNEFDNKPQEITSKPVVQLPLPVKVKMEPIDRTNSNTTISVDESNILDRNKSSLDYKPNSSQLQQLNDIVVKEQSSSPSVIKCENKELEEISRVNQVREYDSDDSCDSDEAIPISAVDNMIFEVDYPKWAMRFSGHLPKRNITEKFNLLDIIKVKLIELNSPYSFNFWVADEYSSYEIMSTNMQSHYTNLIPGQSRMSMDFVIIGHLCAVLTKMAIWKRAIIIKTKCCNTSKNIKVELIDTGETMWVNDYELNYLDMKFAILPPQYISGCLAHVLPSVGDNWSVQSIRYFFDLVKNRELLARIASIDLDGKTLHLVLVDAAIQETQRKNINLRLIQSGWARHLKPQQ